MICLVNYGAGNLASVVNAFDRLGHPVAIVERPEDVVNHDRLILPGVGSFRRAMQNLEARGWPDCLREFAGSGRPMLGICLGMQLLFDEGEEHGLTKGLGLIPGRVVPLEPAEPNRVPHVGWNNLIDMRNHKLFEGVKSSVDYYFVHSYHCAASEPDSVLARTDYGGPFVSAVARGNVVGTQFHPEKSQPAGLKLLENFAEWDGQC